MTNIKIIGKRVEDIRDKLEILEDIINDEGDKDTLEEIISLLDNFNNELWVYV